jgi:hypothetical protein
MDIFCCVLKSVYFIGKHIEIKIFKKQSLAVINNISLFYLHFKLHWERLITHLLSAYLGVLPGARPISTAQTCLDRYG